jgi:hypothetical protein
MFNPLPPIKVFVQNPPGMSEWAKTLLSASVGFVFAMVASVVMEYVKPWIAARSLQRDMSSHLPDGDLPCVFRIRNSVCYPLRATAELRRRINRETKSRPDELAPFFTAVQPPLKELRSDRTFTGPI